MKYFTTFIVLLHLLLNISTAHPQAQESATDEIETVADSETEKTAEENPPGRTEYLGRKIAATMHYTGAPWLVRESREREEDCESMLKNLGVKEGMTICDLGCGNGFYSLRLAKMVGDKGSILAVDIQPEMLHLLELRAKELEIENIEPVLGTFSDPKLPANVVDLILCVDVYHELSHPVLMLEEMRKSLKPDGLIVLVEFRAEDPDVPIKPLHKMTKAQAKKELKENGFRLVREFGDLPWQHMLFFGKHDSGKPMVEAPDSAEKTP